ncbi:glutamate-5-semialdehyde dehydrogenase [Limnochorda pilosa]|uniref:Gamma-glutamyl phosphate reductase n=1 Tax=Limnochorda pilosa TaxID=1555112 RepID=A0A0K2SHR0_LIMPI|nr:glutamate-5-semialdehyde dehydrogenase [Limnochorda pilosa]BAS26643.1 gamma-glutamyl phosphate reductase [Limnochorda pilosa]
MERQQAVAGEIEAVRAQASAARQAARWLARTTTATRDRLLRAMAEALEEAAGPILDANREDTASAAGRPPAFRDRLALDERRLAAMGESLQQVAALPDPLGRGEGWVRPNGLRIRKVRVPLGVVGLIYEARPNVTAEAAALALKAGNAILLRGGSEAHRSNRAVVEALRAGAVTAGAPPDVVNLLPPGRESARALMVTPGLVDVLIPRGGPELIRAVVAEARVPVIETGAGNCHTYVHQDADLEMALRIAVNAKTQRPAVCNAMETLLVHRDAAPAFLPRLGDAMREKGVTLRGCPETRRHLPWAEEATEADWATEYLDLILAVRVVDDLDQALAHIARYTTGHSEAIVTRSLEAAHRFQQEVDAAVVYVNASTRFTDGGEFGLGAEVGISTQKLHARGPMGLEALTTVRFLVEGEGQVR